MIAFLIAHLSPMPIIGRLFSLANGYFFQRLVIIAPHNIAAFNFAGNTNTGTDTYNGMNNMRRVNDTTIGNNRPVYQCARYFCWRQHARTGINVVFIKQVKLRDIICKAKVGIKK
jgi:hypothetical protein